MALPTYKAEKDIPKGFEELYEEIDGEWKPKDSGVEHQEALQKEREKREAAEKNAKTAAKALKDKEREIEAGKSGVTQETVDKIKAEAKAEVEAEYGPKVADRDKLAAENRAFRLTDVIGKMFVEGKGIPEKNASFWKLHGDEFDLTDDGKPMVKGKPGQDVKKHVETLMKTVPEWVQGTRATGSGQTGMLSKPAEDAGGDADKRVLNPAALLAEANIKAA